MSSRFLSTKAFTKVAITVVAITAMAALMVGTAKTSHAECFGEAADAYGCGISAPQEGSLASFGSPGQAVVPRYAQGKGSPFDGLFSRNEHRQMLRSIVLGNLSGAQGASGAFNKAINSNSRALRRSNNRRVNVYYGGWGGY